MAKHLKIGGSTAARTLQCPAWLSRAESCPPQKSTEAADIGNLLHNVMENIYGKGLSAEKQLGKTTYNGHVFNEQQYKDLILPCIKMLEDVLDEYGVAYTMAEPFVQIEKGFSGGSIDLLGVTEDKDKDTVMIIDYKFGSGYVKVENNPQLLFYALAASLDPITSAIFKRVNKIALCIIQPKLSEEARVHEIDIEYLNVFKEKLDTALSNPKQSNTGSECRYCPALPFCPDKKEEAISALILDPKDADSLADALDVVSKVEIWAKEVREQAREIAISGGKVPRYKLVEGRSKRYWIEGTEEQLVSILGDKAYSKTLLTPAKAEKLKSIDKEELDKYIKITKDKPLLVSDSDKREKTITMASDKDIASKLGI